MALPTDRTTANTDAEHVDDHNTLHALHNAYEGTEPADFDPAGTGSAAVTAHAGAIDPHAGYRLESAAITAADVAADVATQAELDAVAAAKVDKATLDANSILYAVANDTPAALALPASTIAARLASGNVVAATPAEIRSLLQTTMLAVVSGSYLTRGGTAGTVLLVNGTLALTPYWLPGDVNQIAINVTGNATAASGATIRFVVYADTGLYAPATSGAPLVDAVAAQTSDTTGDKTATVTVTGNRWVWAGCIGQGAPATQATVRSVGAVTEHLIVPAIPTGNSGPTTNYAGLTGAIPTPIGVSPVAQSLAIPRIGLRMA